MRQNLVKCTTRIKSFYRVEKCYYLKMVNIRKPLQIKLLHKTISLPRDRYIFCLQSFMGQHSKEIHKQFLAFIPFYMYYLIQNPLF
jgi:hypothetical protein